MTLPRTVADVLADHVVLEVESIDRLYLNVYLQAEFSLTQMLDRPLTGRILFEQIIRENLDVGRPDQVGLVFDRKIVRAGPRSTPGRFRTRVITSGVTPSLHVDYKHSKIKQYHNCDARSHAASGYVGRRVGLMTRT